MTDLLEDLGDNRLPGQECPCCGTIIDAATEMTGTPARPQVGDVTICLYCTACLRFGMGGVLVLEPNPPAEVRHLVDRIKMRVRGRTQ